jgi:dihydroneopterin aldolase
VVTLFFVLVRMYASAASHDNLKDFVKYRYVYTLLRIIFFAYFPLTVTGAYVIAYGTVASAIIAAIYLVTDNGRYH